MTVDVCADILTVDVCADSLTVDVCADSLTVDGCADSLTVDGCADDLSGDDSADKLSGNGSTDKLTEEDWSVLCQFFWLPHSHGALVQRLLEDFTWCRDTAPAGGLQPVCIMCDG